MLKHIIIISIFSYSLKSFAIGKEVCEGFYVTHNDDTVKCSFHVPLILIGGISGERGLDLRSLNWSIELNDSIKGKNKLRPGDVKSFNFFYNGKAQVFLAKPIFLDFEGGFISDEDSVFLKTIVEGPLSLYEYQTSSGSKDFGYIVNTSYCLQWKTEKPYGVPNAAKKFREAMIWYLSACPELTKKIESEQYTKSDMEVIVNEYNDNCVKK